MDQSPDVSVRVDRVPVTHASNAGALREHVAHASAMPPPPLPRGPTERQSAQGLIDAQPRAGKSCNELPLPRETAAGVETHARLLGVMVHSAEDAMAGLLSAKGGRERAGRKASLRRPPFDEGGGGKGRGAQRDIDGVLCAEWEFEALILQKTKTRSNRQPAPATAQAISKWLSAA